LINFAFEYDLAIAWRDTSVSDTDDKEKTPRAEKASERTRLAEALRENLRRRKVQNRARTKSGAKTASEPDTPA
jgi:hypothetical protein